MELLASGARRLLNLELTPAQLAAFEIYAGELQAWNMKFNLTAIKDLDGIQVKHFLDSLSLLKVLPINRRGVQSLAPPARAGVNANRRGVQLNAPTSHQLRLVDVGTGAGFPGLPLKIVCPNLRLTLVEATGKKVMFCQALVDRLRLSGVSVLKARAEDIGQDLAHREQYDWAVARAVAELPVLAEYLLPLVRRGGHAVAQKGEGAPAETHAAEGALRRLGGQLEQIVPVELPGIVETRYLVVMRKIAATPPDYPRRAGVPAKSPLL